MTKTIDIEIRSWLAGAGPLYAGPYDSVLHAVEAGAQAAVSLRRADLDRVDLSGADLRGVDLADLRDADLRDADLRGANLSRAIGWPKPA